MFWKKNEETFSVSKEWQAEREAEKKTEIVEPINHKESATKRLQNAPTKMVIEGYKAVKSDMSAFFGKLTYKLGKPEVYPGTIVPCQRGYHFGKTLNDVLEAFPPMLGTRYFKVTAVVPTYSYIDNGTDEVVTVPKDCGIMRFQQDMEKYQAAEGNSRWSYMDDAPPSLGSDRYRSIRWKFVAEQITLTEEIPFEDIVAAMRCKLPLPGLITSKEEYSEIVTAKQLYLLAEKKWKEQANEVFSEGFNSYFFSKYMSKWSSPDTNEAAFNIDCTYRAMVRVLKAVKDEHISQDMKIVLFLNLWDKE